MCLNSLIESLFGFLLEALLAVSFSSDIFLGRPSDSKEFYWFILISPLGRLIIYSSRSTFYLSFLSRAKTYRGSSFYTLLGSGEEGFLSSSNKNLSKLSFSLYASSYRLGPSPEFPLFKLILLPSLDFVTLAEECSLRLLLLCSLLFSNGSKECYFLLASGGLPISVTSFLSLKNAESNCSFVNFYALDPVLFTFLFIY